MECMKSTSTAQQQEKVIGPTVVVLYKNEVERTRTDEESGEKETYYEYDFYRFSIAEYENLKSGGMLPQGAVWDDTLRSIERSGMYDRADVLIAKANDYIACGTDEEAQAWTAFRDAVREWKMAVRRTQDKKGYPKKVTYPAMPSAPQ